MNEIASSFLSFAARVIHAGDLVARQITRVESKRHYRQEVLEIREGSVVLKIDEESVRPGIYGLWSADAHVVVGGPTVIDERKRTVERVIVRRVSGKLTLGPVTFGHIEVGDPKSAHDLEFFSVDVESSFGRFPAWVVGPSSPTWIVIVHGYRGSLQSSLSILPGLLATGARVLVCSYRNDESATRSSDHRFHLGETEWQDVEAALLFAIESGAQQIVIYGRSMGGAIALQCFSRSSHRDAVAGLILDVPVLDWESVLMFQAKRTHVPRFVMREAMSVLARRLQIDFAAYNWPQRANDIDVPTLLFQSDGDPMVPMAPAQSLHEQRPFLVKLVSFDGAGHMGTWNADPLGYERSIKLFLDPIVSRVD